MSSLDLFWEWEDGFLLYLGLFLVHQKKESKKITSHEQWPVDPGDLLYFSGMKYYPVIVRYSSG